MKSRRITSVLNRVILLIGLLLVGCLISFGQSRSELEREQDGLRKKIARTRTLLETNKNDQEASIGRLRLQEEQVTARQALVKTYEKELQDLKIQSKQLKHQMRLLEEKKNKLSYQYQALLRSSYRAKLTDNRWLFLLSSSSFGQAFRRWRYLSRINQAWKKQLQIWTDTNLEINAKLDALRLIENNKKELLVEAREQKAKLEADKKVLQSMLASLQQDQKTLQQTLQDYVEDMERLRRAIEKIVAKTAGNHSSTSLPLTPAMVRLAASFEANAGQLPWPVEQGVIIRQYGVQAHHHLKNIQVRNNGIDIQTALKSPVKCIFQGKVLAKQIIPGFGTMIIVAHGDYYSVYSQINHAFVEPGDQVDVGHLLGIAQDKEGFGQLHLEIWKGKQILNPESWLQSLQ